MNLIVFPVILNLFSAFLIALLWKKSKIYSGIACLCFSLLSLISVILLGKYVFQNQYILYYVGGWEIPIGITLMVDALSYIFLLVLNFILPLICWFSLTYMGKYVKSSYFYILFSLISTGLNGILISMDFFNIYVFLEISSIASYILVAFGLKTEELEASLKYTMLGFIGSVLILVSIGLILGKTGTLNIADFMNIAIGMDRIQLWFILGLFISGLALKTALFPFHFWLPDAHSLAPSPVSAILSGIFIKITGFYLLIRIVSNIFIMFSESKIIVMGLGLSSMIFGALMAIDQKDIKRTYAYSSISQIGYCALALGIGGYWGYLGAILHFIFHSLSKSLLFLNSGAIEYKYKTTKIDDLKGIEDKMPYTTMTGFVGMLSIAGIPPFGCFWSKIIIIISAIKAHYYGIAFIAVVVSIITLGYFLKLLRNIFYSKDENPKINEVNFNLLMPMVLLSIIIFLGGLIFSPNIKIYIDKAVSVMENFSYAQIMEK
ncbi:MAG: NADH/ubiquinone/plastoquinone (complex I) [Candidatus Omnitrophica bacterium]|nr:NADH/ubiquinone/plastoquinone (complex I) [Candidatus Omnitrophota bacterium]MCM8809361.1 NADH/ubiquinone/plastoquinone (complex I) [Candidatus Omnitrophota bacterium]MCM8832634.1 NADH/ubiquinone/plastoquinone (complex I) [Candidatus Omnitrophota bacterium]